MRGSGTLQPRFAAVFVLLALPDWSLFFQPVDRVAQGGERFFPVRSAHGYEDAGFSELEPPDSVDDPGLDSRPAFGYFVFELFDLFAGHRLVGVVVDAADRSAKIGIPNRSGKGENRSVVVVGHLVDDRLAVNHIVHDPAGHFNLRSTVE